MNELTGGTVRGPPVPAELKAAGVDGARLAYAERGCGEPVVFVHGSLSNLTIWQP